MEASATIETAELPAVMHVNGVKHVQDIKLELELTEKKMGLDWRLAS